MTKKLKHNQKTIEQTDYELKSKNKFASDEEFPETEQSKQTKQGKGTKNLSKEFKKNKKIEQNPGEKRVTKAGQRK